jgi:hypothetical protein
LRRQITTDVNGTRSSRNTSIDTKETREQEDHAQELADEEAACRTESVQSARDRRDDPAIAIKMVAGTRLLIVPSSKAGRLLAATRRG